MRVIKGENQYAIVVSKDELRYLTACVGSTNYEIIEPHIKKKPDYYGADEMGKLDTQKIFKNLYKSIPNRVDS